MDDSYIGDGMCGIFNEPSPWGGPWTEEKLDAFEKYVNAYLTIMNRYRDRNEWKLIYFDGFAGSGSRIDRAESEESDLLHTLFSDSLIEKEELEVYKGAAERVLGINQRGFDYYYFVDKDKEASLKLQRQLAKYKSEKKLEFRVSDANEQIRELASAMQKNHKLVSFVLLDPFGMQVDWQSIEKLRETHTDLWILIPTGVIINRLLDRKGALVHIDKLTSFFGKDEDFLKSFFFQRKKEPTLFGDVEIVEKVKQPIQKIAELYIQQLHQVFKFVTREPLVLYNTRKTPIFHFACASNNETAIKIASQIINKKQRP